MNKRIIICGAGGSGKDTLKNRFIAQGFSRSISCTTRPPRDKEVHGIDYIFMDDSGFEELREANLFLEVEEFKGWKYATQIDEWNSKDVFIMTPTAIERLSEEDFKSCFVIYLDIDARTRIDRLLKRQDADSAERRFNADEIMFEGFERYHMKVTNPFF